MRWNLWWKQAKQRGRNETFGLNNFSCMCWCSTSWWWHGTNKNKSPFANQQHKIPVEYFVFLICLYAGIRWRIFVCMCYMHFVVYFFTHKHVNKMHYFRFLVIHWPWLHLFYDVVVQVTTYVHDTYGCMVFYLLYFIRLINLYVYFCFSQKLRIRRKKKPSFWLESGIIYFYVREPRENESTKNDWKEDTGKKQHFFFCLYSCEFTH